MSTNLEYRARERQGKRKCWRQASEAQRRKKSDRVLELELLEEQHETFVTAVRKREKLAATNARENERH